MTPIIAEINSLCKWIVYKQTVRQTHHGAHEEHRFIILLRGEYLIHRLRRRQHVPGIDMGGEGADFEMQVRSAGVTGTADRTDHVTLAHTLAADYIDGAQVGIQRLEVVAVVHHDHVTVAVIIPAGVNDHACVGGINTLTFVAGNVDAPMVRTG